jgi:hypothetical protein
MPLVVQVLDAQGRLCGGLQRDGDGRLAPPQAPRVRAAAAPAP